MPCLTVLAPPNPRSARAGKAFGATHGSNQWFLVSGSNDIRSRKLRVRSEMLFGFLCSRADWDGDDWPQRAQLRRIPPDDFVVEVDGARRRHGNDQGITNLRCRGRLGAALAGVVMDVKNWILQFRTLQGSCGSVRVA